MITSGKQGSTIHWTRSSHASQAQQRTHAVMCGQLNQRTSSSDAPGGREALSLAGSRWRPGIGSERHVKPLGILATDTASGDVSEAAMTLRAELPLIGAAYAVEHP